MTTNSPETLPTVHLLGVRVHAVRESVCIAHVLDGIAEGRGGWVVTPNLDILRRAVHDATFAQLIDRADLIVPDGMPLIWASRLQRTPLPERVAGSTLIVTLCAAAGGAGRRVFLLGGAPGAAERAANALESRCPGLILAGTYCPPFGFEHNAAELDRIRGVLRDTRPEIVFVALGSPKQELLIARLRLEFPGAWWLGVGISLSFLAGDVHRAPRWVQNIGFEWLHRLIQEPKRLAKRYLVDGLPFAARLFVTSAWRGLTGRASRSAAAS